MDTKLIEQVQALLRGAGFADVDTHEGGEAVTVSGTKGPLGAVFHLTTLERADRARQETTGGGPNPNAPAAEVWKVVSFPELREQLATDPHFARATGLTAEMLARLR